MLARDFPHCVEIVVLLGGFGRAPSRPNRSSSATGKVPTKRFFSVRRVFFIGKMNEQPAVCNAQAVASLKNWDSISVWRVI